MKELYVYHVVTEEHMVLGQRITFDHKHTNGVYKRVATCKQIIDGEDIKGDLADFIKSDMNKWSSVTYRELALEKVRQCEYPNYPSRMACLYTSRTLEEARRWADYFKRIGRKVYSIVKLKVVGNVFDGDACNCFDGTSDEEYCIKKARHYWRSDLENDNPIIETLVDGEITVVDIIEELIN
jgi:hypothetical protein